MSAFPNKPDQLLLGIVAVSSSDGSGGVVLDPNTGVYAVDYYINGNSVNTSIGGIVNDVSQLEDFATLITDVVLPAYNDSFNNSNTYFNDINVAIQGLDEAVENSQNDIANIQNELNAINVPDIANSVNTNQILVSSSNLLFKVNLSSSPQVSFNANGATLPFVSVERNFGGDFAQSIHEPSGLAITHSYTTIGSEDVPYLTFTDSVIGKTSSIYFGSADPNVNLTPDGGSMYLRNNGDILTGDGGNWISYLGGLLALNSQVSNLSNVVAFRDSQEIYVSGDGNDITGTGSILEPYQTIQKAVQMAELVASPSSQVSIYVGAGTYTENILITKGYISIIGETSTAVQSGHYGITGDITINKTDSDDLFQCFVILQGLVIRGSVVDLSSKEHSVTLQDCRIVVPNTRSYAFRVSEYTPGAYVDKRIRLINCQMTENDATAFTDSLVEIDGGGWLYMERCDLTTKSVISAVELGSSSYLARMALCSIECSSSSVSLPPQIFFNQINVPPANTIQSIGQTTIVAPNGGGATGANGLNTAIHIATGVATTSFSVYGVICGIAGNPFPNDIITNQFALAVPLIYADFFALPGTAHKIGANITKAGMTVVN